MPDGCEAREDVIVSLALSLKRNQLSADEFQQMLALMSRAERASLVEYLDRLSKGLVDIQRESSSTQRRNVA